MLFLSDNQQFESTIETQALILTREKSPTGPILSASTTGLISEGVLRALRQCHRQHYVTDANRAKQR